jgi:hypothetical protein
MRAVGVNSGGRFAQRLRELEEAGFTASLTPYGRRSKHTLTRLIDEYARGRVRANLSASRRLATRRMR